MIIMLTNIEILKERAAELLAMCDELIESGECENETHDSLCDLGDELSSFLGIDDGDDDAITGT